MPDDQPNDVADYRARLFVVAGGYAWSSHLLLVSAQARFQNGLANSSGLVGRYMGGHKFISANIEMDAEIYPGMNGSHSLVSRKYFRCEPTGFFVRHDFRVWEAEHQPRLRGDDGKVLLGDEVTRDWRARAKRGRARVRMYYDVHPDPESRLTLDPSRKNRYGDPLPNIEHRLDAATLAREERTKAHIESCSQATRSQWQRPDCIDAIPATISITRQADAGWGPIRARVSPTATGARTITKTCSSLAHRRCRPAAARTARSRSLPSRSDRPNTWRHR